MTPPQTKRLALSALVAAFAVQTVLVYSDERYAPLDDVAKRGRELWHRHGCQVCHQLYGQGGFLGPDLTNAYSTVDTMRLRTLLTAGSGQMPPFHFSDREIADFRAFLRAMDQPERGRGQLRLGRVSEAGPWERFDQAVEELVPSSGSQIRAGWEAMRLRPCHACHQPLAAAPTGAPDLSRVVARLDSSSLREVLGQGRLDRGMPPPVPAFTPDEIDDVIAFLGWIGRERDALGDRLEATAADRSWRWRDIPWWEYR